MTLRRVPRRQGLGLCSQRVRAARVIAKVENTNRDDLNHDLNEASFSTMISIQAFPEIYSREYIFFICRFSVFLCFLSAFVLYLNEKLKAVYNSL